MDRRAAEQAYGDNYHRSATAAIPEPIRQVWDAYQFNLIDKSKATVGLLAGQHGVNFLSRYVRSRRVRIKIFYEDGSTWHVLNQKRMPIAIKQFGTGASHKKLIRLWFVTYHPEWYMRRSSPVISYTTQCESGALRERLIDMAYVIAYGSLSPRPAYLSTLTYFTDRMTGLIIPQRDLERIDCKDIKTMIEMFRKPCDPLLDNLSSFLNASQSWSLVANKEFILDVAQSVSLQTEAAFEYWNTKAVLQTYGAKATSYKMLLENRVHKPSDTDLLDEREVDDQRITAALGQVEELYLEHCLWFVPHYAKLHVGAG